MKKKNRTKNEKKKILSTKKIKVEADLKKTEKEIQRLKIRIERRSLEGLSTKFLQKILSTKKKAARSIKWKLTSVENELSILQNAHY
ncbi:hypothetical protein J5751_01280 [bacterium]|nr:hypothetical protein [bacterium]